LYRDAFVEVQGRAANEFPHPGKLTRWQLFFYTSGLLMPFHFYSDQRLRKPNVLRPLGVFFHLLSVLLLFASPSFGQSKTEAESFDSLAKRAAEARDADRLDEAVSLYKKGLVLRPKWAEGWWSLGTLEYDRNNYASAARAFRQLLPLAPKDGTAYVMLGLCEFELGQDDAALKHLEEGKNLGIATNPQLRVVTLFHDGILLLSAGKFRAAEENFSGLCEDSIPNEEVVKNLGLAVFRLSPKFDPPPGTPGAGIILRAGHAACITAQRKYHQARKEYSELVAEYPSYPNIHYVFGKFLAEIDVPAAIAEFQQELKNNPRDINSRLEIAATQYKLDSVAGIPYAEEALRINPHIPFAHYLLGLLYLDTDDYQKAIPELEIAQKAFPKDKKVYFALGSAYSRAGRKQDAEKARAGMERLNKESGAESRASY
jgi:tetratricopeptide (TPR) repeat protein